MASVDRLQKTGVQQCGRIILRRFPGQGAQDEAAEPVHPLFCRATLRRAQDDELLMAIPPEFLPRTIAGLRALSKNRLRYPIPPYGVNNDVREGMGVICSN